MHLAAGFAEIGMRRKEWYLFHWHNGCPLVGENVRNLLKPWCAAYQQKHLDAVNILPNGSVVVAGNWWNKNWGADYQDSSKMDAIKGLKNDIESMGRELVVLEEPPGVDKKAITDYYRCGNLAILPIARLWGLLSGHNYTGATYCADLKNGLPPKTGRMQELREYKTVVPEMMPNLKVVDVMEHLCGKVNSTEEEVKCQLPTNLTGIVYDIGYCIDGGHLSAKRSRGLSEFYEKTIFGNE